MVPVFGRSAGIIEVTPGKALQEGVARHRAGRLPEVEAAYRRALAAEPGNPDALEGLRLEFLGFNFPAHSPALAKYRGIHREAGAPARLSPWHRFELDNPDTFAGMYQVWVRKP